MSDKSNAEIQIESGELKISPIRVVKGIIEDNYPPRTFLKEIVQNADDAEATSLHLGWHPGWPYADNPLLRSPLIVALNNGGFRNKDVEAIKTFYAGAKGEDYEKIGKYGLGLKSVFNLSECVFILASPGHEASGSRPFFMQLNPSEKIHHPKSALWAMHPVESAKLLLSLVTNWQHKLERWFCVIAPLRTRELVEGVEPLSRSYPVPRDVFDDSLASNMALMLPLLAHIDRIAIWELVDDNQKLLQEVEINANSQKRLKLDELKPGTSHEIHGHISAKDYSTGGSTTFSYAGCEFMLKEELVDNLKRNESWPTTDVLDTTEGPITISSMARPHTASVFICASRKSGNGCLEAVDYVFLPLWGDPTCEPLEGGLDYRLVLHGYYFVDKGRKAVTATAKDADKTTNIKNDWNVVLQHNGVYPNILPALSLFVRYANLPHQDITILTQGLQGIINRSSNESRNMSAWMGSRGWIWCINSNDTGYGIWRLLDNSQAYLELPSPSRVKDRQRSAALALSVFPSLVRLAANAHITVRNLPRINCHDPASWADRPDVVSGLLESVRPESLKDPDELEFLCCFVAQVNSENESLNGPSHDALLGFLRRLLPMCFGRTQLAPSSEARQLLQSIGRKRSVALISLNKNASVWRELCHLMLTKFPFPSCLAPDSTGGLFGPDDVKQIFRSLQAMEIDTVARSEIAYDVLKHTVPTPDLYATLGDIPVFAIQGIDTKTVPAKWSTLKDIHDKRQLFTGGYGGLLPFLRNAVKQTTIYFIPAMDASYDLEPFDILFRLGAPPKLDGAGCLAILSKAPPLNHPDKRVSLLNNLKSYIQSSPNPIRYLIHGEESAFDKSMPMFVENNHTDQVLVKVCLAALRNVKAGWRMAPAVLTDKLTQHEMDQLGLKLLDIGCLMEVLHDSPDIGWLSTMGLTDDERFRLIDQIQKADTEDYWRQLPIHELLNRKRLQDIDGVHVFLCRTQKPSYVSLAEVALLVKPPAPATWSHLYARLEEWGAMAALQVVTEQEDPSAYASEILDALSELQRKGQANLDTIKARLRDSAWLPGVKKGTRYKPSEIMHLNGLEDALAQLLTGVFPVVLDIEPATRDHPAFPWVLNNLLVPKSETLTAIGLGLENSANCRFGDIRACIDNHSIGLGGMVRVFKGIPSEIMPILPILNRLFDGSEKDESIELEILVREQLLEPLMKNDPAPAVCRKYLDFLRESHKSRGEKEKNEALAFFKCYLRMLLRQEDWPFTEGGSFELLSRAGNWKKASSLSHSGSLREDDLVDKDIEEILFLTRQDILHGDDLVDSTSPVDLKTYFGSWDKWYPQVGALLSLLGNSKDVEGAAQFFLDSSNRIEVETIRTELDLTQKAVDGSFVTKVAQDIRKKRFEILITNSADTVIARSLVGTQFKAYLNSTPTHLFVQSQFSPNTKRIDLRLIDPNSYSEIEVNQLLKSSALKILVEIYLQPETTIDKLWFGMENSEQFEIEVTQQLIIEHIGPNLRNLGIQRLTRLSKQRAQLENAETQATQRRVLAEKSKDQKRKWQEIQHEESSVVADQEVRTLKDKLKTTIETDPLVQAQILEAVRYRVGKDNHYRPESVPFELFQNADDAAAELSEMLNINKSDPLPNLDCVRFKWDSQKLAVINWGRPINKCGYGLFDPKQGMINGYHRDLEKMVLLHDSDKEGEASGADGVRVTGKFGLGFKSVFLVSECPRIRSGRLSFDIVGGFYPRHFSPNETKEVSEWVTSGDGNSSETTVIVIPIDQTTKLTPDRILQKFIALGPVSLAFSRKVKRLQFTTTDKEMIWRDNAVKRCPGVFVSELHWVDPNTTPRRGLLVRQSDDIGAFLIGLDHRGFQALPTQVPSVWFTEPTESQRCGFAVNGPFIVGMARRSIPSGSQENEHTARTIGHDIGQRLAALADLLNDQSASNQVLEELCIGKSTDNYTIWQSLWNIVGHGLAKTFVTGNESPEKKLILSLLWCEGAGARYMYDSCPTLPTELQGKYKTTTTLPHVKCSISGILDQNEKAFIQISTWSSLGLFGEPGEMISDSRVAEPLRTIYDSLVAEPLRNLKLLYPTVQKIALAKIMENETSKVNYRVNCEQAERFGALFKLLGGEFVDSNEYKESLKPLLSKLLFETDPSQRTGKALFKPAAELVCRGFDNDETLQAAFAPSDRVLSSSYSKNADLIKFFAMCRDRKNTPSNVLAEWMLSAKSHQRNAVLHYLAKGESIARLRNELAAMIPGSWLADLAIDSPEFGDMNSDDKFMVFAVLQRPLEVVGGATVAPGPVVVRSPEKTLRDIYDWWHINRIARLAKYNSQIYENGIIPIITAEPPEGSKIQWREEWLKLFLTAILQTLGRTQRQQNRGFVHHCSGTGILRTMANNGSWLDDVTKRFENRDDDFKSYFRWFEKMIGLHLISRNIDDYALLYGDQINRLSHMNLEDITMPRRSAELQHGGPNLPPLRSVFGRGANFMLRELARMELVTCKAALPYCYVGFKRVRRLLHDYLGFPDIEGQPNQSTLIHGFLMNKLGDDRAYFERSFDITFEIISEDPDLLYKFFRTEQLVPSEDENEEDI